jgi:RecA-family ATPase
VGGYPASSHTREDAKPNGADPHEEPAQAAPGEDDAYKTPGLTKVWKSDEPEARQFAVAGIVPDGAVTLFYGDGGQGKSYIALALAMLSCMGQPFLGRYVEQRQALYIDAELDVTEFTRRAYKLARGMGVSRPPDGLHYYQLAGSLSEQVVQGRVMAAHRESKAGFVVLDSLSIGSYAADASDASDMIGVLKFLERLGCPVIAIDHIAKPMPGANLSQYRAFGTVFKGNVARSAIQVIKADGGALTLLHKKSNFSALSDPLHLILEFYEDDNSVRVSQITAGDERLAGIEENLPAAEQVLRELAKYPDGARPEFLATELDKSLKTIKNNLSVLHKQNRAYAVGDGTWRAR